MIFTCFFIVVVVVVLEWLRTIQPRVAFLVNFLHFLGKCCLCPQMAPRACWGWKCELGVTHVGCPGEGSHNQPLLHRLLSSLLAPTLVRLNYQYWDIRLGGSFPWKHITWPWCPFSFWPFWPFWWERCNKKLWPARANSSDENLGHPWFMSTAGAQGVPTSREHLKWNNRDCLLPMIVNKSKPAGEKNSFTSFFF